jgi:arginase family enzyme
MGREQGQREVVAPATRTPETEGCLTRELRTIFRGLEGINSAVADIVEAAVSSFQIR